eukprot:Ihof_evm3s334 gene=Ihof_evmTU3s334
MEGRNKPKETNRIESDNEENWDFVEDFSSGLRQEIKVIRTSLKEANNVDATLPLVEGNRQWEDVRNTSIMSMVSISDCANTDVDTSSSIGRPCTNDCYCHSPLINRGRLLSEHTRSYDRTTDDISSTHQAIQVALSDSLFEAQQTVGDHSDDNHKEQPVGDKDMVTIAVMMDNSVEDGSASTTNNEDVPLHTGAVMQSDDDGSTSTTSNEDVPSYTGAVMQSDVNMYMLDNNSITKIHQTPVTSASNRMEIARSPDQFEHNKCASLQSYYAIEELDQLKHNRESIQQVKNEVKNPSKPSMKIENIDLSESFVQDNEYNCQLDSFVQPHQQNIGIDESMIIKSFISDKSCFILTGSDSFTSVETAAMIEPSTSSGLEEFLDGTRPEAPITHGTVMASEKLSNSRYGITNNSDVGKKYHYLYNRSYLTGEDQKKYRSNKDLNHKVSPVYGCHLFSVHMDENRDWTWPSRITCTHTNKRFYGFKSRRFCKVTTQASDLLVSHLITLAV